MPKTNIPKIKSSGSSTPVSKQATQTSRSNNISQDQNKNDTAEEVEDPEELEDNEEQEEGAEQEKPSGPHFDTIDTIFYLFIAILGDVFDGIWVTRILFAPITILFLYLKGVDQMISKNMISQAVELIPVVGWLPISTTMAIFTIVLTNHPELLDKLGTTGQALEKINEASKKAKI